MGKRKSQEEFVNQVYEKYGYEYTVRGKYKNGSIKVVVYHNKCDDLIEVTPSVFIGKNFICKNCNKNKSNRQNIVFDKEIEKELMLNRLKIAESRQLELNKKREADTIKPVLSDKVINANRMNYKDVLIGNKLDYQIEESLPLNKFVLKMRKEKDLTIKEFKNSGVYIFTDKITNETLYIGTSVDLFKRFSDHLKGWGSTSLRNMIFENLEHHSEPILDLHMKNVIAHVIFDDDMLSQLFLEKYLIRTLNPKFNKEAVRKHKTNVSIEDKIIAINMLR